MSCCLPVVNMTSGNTYHIRYTFLPPPFPDLIYPPFSLLFDSIYIFIYSSWKWWWWWWEGCLSCVDGVRLYYVDPHHIFLSQHNCRSSSINYSCSSCARRDRHTSVFLGKRTSGLRVFTILSWDTHNKGDVLHRVQCFCTLDSREEGRKDGKRGVNGGRRIFDHQLSDRFLSVYRAIVCSSPVEEEDPLPVLFLPLLFWRSWRPPHTTQPSTTTNNLFRVNREWREGASKLYLSPSSTMNGMDEPEFSKERWMYDFEERRELSRLIS